MLTSTELRKLVRAHNKLSKIVIPKGSSRDDIIKLIEKAGYKVDHERKAIKPKVQRGKQITLSQAEELTKPKPKTELQKQKAQEKKAEKEAMKKKQEREIRKKAVQEEKERQKKSILKKKSDNNMKGDSEKMGDTKSNYQVKDDEIRFDFYDDKSNKTKQRFVSKVKDGYDTLLKLIKDKGYNPSKKQEETLKESLINYVSNKESLKGVDIKRGKGKTDMIIISASGHDFGSGIASIRIKKSVLKKKS